MAVAREVVVLRAMFAPADVHAWYRKRLQKLVTEMAQSMLLHARAAYRKSDPDIGFAQDDDPIVELRRAVLKWSTRWLRKLEGASAEIAEMFATRAQSSLDRRFRAKLKAAGFTVKFKPTESMTQAYRLVVAENVNLIRSIPQQFLKDVQTSVWDSVMRGGDMSTLSQSIKKNYAVGWRRAALIARDQNAKAHAVFEAQRRTDLGITQAIWQHSSAGKVPRPEHVKWGRERARYEVKKGMWSEFDGRYVWPGTPINCRCSSRAIIPGVTD